MKLRHVTRSTQAFSLVEVVLAIGLIAFCLIALVSLFGVGLKNSRQSSDDTALSSAVTQVGSELTGLTNFTSSNMLFFDRDGERVAQSEALYVCQVTTKSVPPSQISEISTNLVQATLTFTWPASAPYTSRRTNVFYVTFPFQ